MQIESNFFFSLSPPDTTYYVTLIKSINDGSAFKEIQEFSSSQTVKLSLVLLLRRRTKGDMSLRWFLIFQFEEMKMVTN